MSESTPEPLSVSDDESQAPLECAAALEPASSSEREHAKQIAFIAILAYLLFTFCVPLITLPHLHTRHAMLIFAGVVTLFTTLVFMFLQVWMPKAIVALRPSIGACIGAFAACGAAFYFLFMALHHPFMIKTYGEYTVVSAGKDIAETIGLTFLGALLSRIIREINVLLPVAFVAMPIDYIGAMTPIGFTQNAVKHHPDAVAAVMVKVPVAHGIAAIGFIGPGDVLFLAFFFAVVQNLKLNVRGTFWLTFLFLSITMFLVTVLGINIAALIPMGLAVLIANKNAFKLDRSEVFAMFYAIAIVMAVVVAFYLTSHKYIFKGK